MRLIELKKIEDYGKEYQLILFSFGRHFPGVLKDRTLVQVSISLDDFPSLMLYLLMGQNGLFSLLVCIYRVSFAIDIFTYRWSGVNDIL